MFTFYQNLNERPDGSTGFPRHARAALGRLHISWQFPTWFCFMQLQRDPIEGAWRLAFACGLFALWITVEDVYRTKPGDYHAREVSLSIHDWSLWWNFWTPSDSWSSSTPRYRYGSFDLLDFLFGRVRFSDKVLEHAVIDVPMPERSYRARATLRMGTWKRPRWFAKHRMTVHIDCDEPVPIPGKGENSWDCGDDAIHSLSTPARSIEDGVADLVRSALETRRRYGGMQGIRV